MKSKQEEKKNKVDQAETIAYFSMEIGISADIPTYSGGLGVLAGDTIRTAADLKIPMAAVTLLHRAGYFYQKLDGQGAQTESPVEWVVENFLVEMDARVTVTIEERVVYLRVWKYEVEGLGGYKVPIYFLDSDLAENAEGDRMLTNSLYHGDHRYRLCQEIILGIGGVRMLRALGYKSIKRFHMNEGHSSLLGVELLNERLGDPASEPSSKDMDDVKRKCVFTTHTPVTAGHDRFPLDLVNHVLGAQFSNRVTKILGPAADSVLNMTHLALNLSNYVNGVAEKHGEVSRQMFPNYVIDAITNGVHAATWVSEPFQELFDRYIPGWKEDNSSLRYALYIPKNEVWEAHIKMKQKLIQAVNRQTNVGMDVDVLTLGFARRMAAYKRPDLLFRDAERLKSICAALGAIQVIFSGKAHPQDQPAKDLIRRIYTAMGELKDHVKIVYLANYDISLAKLLTSAVDIWLNTPEPPLEASGTSGMKAALNGIPSLSVLDGWWIEGCIEGVTGWAIASEKDGGGVDYSKDAEHLYRKLEERVIPCFYENRDNFIGIMLQAIALNGSFFNTQRMMREYLTKAYSIA